MKQLLSAIILLLTLCADKVLCVTENNYLLRHIRIESGLSDNRVVGCAQDKYGYMWFATRDGINRYDGYEYVVFRYDKKDPHSIPSSSFSHIEHDKEGNIWASTLSGMCVFDYTSEKFALIDFTSGKEIKYFKFDKDNNVWFILDGELVKYNHSSKKAEKFHSPNGNEYTAFCIDKDIVWGADSKGLLHIVNNRDDAKGQYYDLFSNSKEQDVKNITVMEASPTSNRLYIAYEKDDIKIFDTKNKTYRDLNLQSNYNITFIVNTFLEKSDNELWIGTDAGLLIYNLNADKCSYSKFYVTSTSIRSRRFITDIYKDNDGGTWICTKRNGIDYVSPSRPFAIYHPQSTPDYITGSVIRDVCSDKYDNIWIGTEDAGVNCLESSKKKFTNYQPSTNESNLKHINIRALATYGDKLYIGHVIHGIDVMDIPSRKIIKNYSLRRDVNKTNNSSVNFIKVLNNGTIYVATDEGMYKFDQAKDKFVPCDNFPNEAIRCVYEDSKGNIWAGVSNKCFVYSPVTGKSDAFVYDDYSSDNNNFINDMHEDADGNMWLATNEGLIKYAIRTGESTCFTQENGMPSNKAFKILQDDKGRLWTSTTAGLICLDPKTNRMVTFNESHGLPTRQFNKGAAYVGKDGMFYFGTVDGVIFFDPKEISINDSTEDVKIGDVLVLDDENTRFAVNRGYKDEVKNITLRHDQSTFEITFSTMDYIAPSSMKFFYRIENKWIQTRLKNKVKFTHMAPGKYEFEIKCSQTDNTIENPSTKLYITILPPFWQSGKAHFIYTLLFLGFAYTAITLWRRRLQRNMRRKYEEFEEKKTNELNLAKLNFFINIAHEVRTPLTLIKGPLERLLSSSSISEKDNKSLKIMYKNVDQLLSLVNQLLQVKDNEIAAYKPFFVNVDIVELMRETISRYKDTDSNMTIEVSSEIEDEKIYVAADKEMLVKIFNNLLINAFKYGDKYIWINLSLDKSGELVYITIANDGNVIDYKYKDKIFEPFFRKEDKADKVVGSGLGLPLARSLAEINNGTLELVKNDKYTTFRLSIPVKQGVKTMQEEAGSDAEAESKAAPLVYEHDRSTILVVEDNAELNRFIAEEINQTYNVMVAYNGKEAISILEKEKIQLIISDIMMPVMDGIELLKKVKNTAEWSNIPVILLTARSNVESRIEGLRLGADVYLDKPFSNVLLKTHVTNLLYNRNIVRKFYFESPVANMKPVMRNRTEEEFMEKFNSIVAENIGNPDLSIDMIAEKMNMSKANLFKKVKSASEMSPNEIIKLTRLKKAAALLIEGKMKMSEISESLGFHSQSYFSLAFMKQFGVTPSKYAKENK